MPKSIETVVLLHGIFRGKSSMRGMEKGLLRHGYSILNLNYSSRKKPIEHLIDDIHREISGSPRASLGKLHFVGHSMGGLIIRAYLNKFMPEILGRVVMLGTPNQGSEAADFLAKTALYRFFYGPAGQQLVTDQTPFRDIFGAVNYELGVIAGDRSLDPIVSRFIIPGANDGRVAVERTKVPGMKDHVVLHISHTFMPSNREAILQTQHFLTHGQFLRQE